MQLEFLIVESLWAMTNTVLPCIYKRQDSEFLWNKHDFYFVYLFPDRTPDVGLAGQSKTKSDFDAACEKFGTTKQEIATKMLEYSKSGGKTLAGLLKYFAP